MDAQVGKHDNPGSLGLSRRGKGMGPEPPHPSSAHLPKSPNGSLELLATLTTLPGGVVRDGLARWPISALETQRGRGSWRPPGCRSQS